MSPSAPAGERALGRVGFRVLGTELRQARILEIPVTATEISG
jgi:hypothetical protein